MPWLESLIHDADGNDLDAPSAPVRNHCLRSTIIRGLRLDEAINVDPRVRLSSSPLVVDLELTIRDPECHATQRTGSTIRQDWLIARVRELALAGDVEKAGPLADRIMEFCCSIPGVERTRVRVLRQGTADADAIGVEVERSLVSNRHGRAGRG